MVRLRNRVTGSVVRVDEGLAGRLGPEWVPADRPALTPAVEPEPKRTRKPRSRARDAE
jgi:hypothetical protein